MSEAFHESHNGHYGLVKGFFARLSILESIRIVCSGLNYDCPIISPKHIKVVVISSELIP